MSATIIHLSAVLKSDFVFDVSKKARNLSCSAVVSGAPEQPLPVLVQERLRREA
jgi:hypothetical protein